MGVNEGTGGWVVIGLGPGLRQLVFQRVTEWAPSALALLGVSRQRHLGIR